MELPKVYNEVDLKILLDGAATSQEVVPFVVHTMLGRRHLSAPVIKNYKFRINLQ